MTKRFENQIINGQSILNNINADYYFVKCHCGYERILKIPCERDIKENCRKCKNFEEQKEKISEQCKKFGSELVNFTYDSIEGRYSVNYKCKCGKDFSKNCIQAKFLYCEECSKELKNNRNTINRINKNHTYYIINSKIDELNKELEFIEIKKVIIFFSFKNIKKNVLNENLIFCKCNCGKEFVTRLKYIKNKQLKDCGCRSNKNTEEIKSFATEKVKIDDEIIHDIISLYSKKIYNLEQLSNMFSINIDVLTENIKDYNDEKESIKKIQ